MSKEGKTEGRKKHTQGSKGVEKEGRKERRKEGKKERKWNTSKDAKELLSDQNKACAGQGTCRAAQNCAARCCPRQILGLTSGHRLEAEPSAPKHAAICRP